MILFLDANNGSDLPLGVIILFMVVFFTIAIILIILMFRSIKKTYLERKENILSEVDDGTSTRQDLVLAMEAFIKRYRFDNEMTLVTFEYENIKSIRETFGERQYERAIRQLASRVRAAMPKNCILAATGNEQYTILLRGQIPHQALEGFVNVLVKKIEEPLALSISFDSKVNVTVSAGIVTYPDGGHFPNDLIKNSEMALFIAKNNPNKSYIFYNAQKDQSDDKKIEYYREIKEAMRNKEFSLVYQPIIDTQDKQIAGFESLIRWNHPTLGVLSPNKFLNIMEHTGDIIWVGKWGIEVLCNQYNDWSKKLSKDNFFLSFNLSPKQLLDPQIATDFNAIVKRNRVNPAHICLEIVEFAMFEKYSIVSENIEKLHNYGFKIAVDDFGLDSNSLSRIANLPLDIIKFDRNFLSDIEGNYMLTRVANMLIEFSKDNKKLVIAEGVENYEMLDKLEAMGVHIAQGYLFSKPSSPFELDRYIKDDEFMKVFTEREYQEVGKEQTESNENN